MTKTTPGNFLPVQAPSPKASHEGPCMPAASGFLLPFDSKRTAGEQPVMSVEPERQIFLPFTRPSLASAAPAPPSPPSLSLERRPEDYQAGMSEQAPLLGINRSTIFTSLCTKRVAVGAVGALSVIGLGITIFSAASLGDNSSAEGPLAVGICLSMIALAAAGSVYQKFWGVSGSVAQEPPRDVLMATTQSPYAGPMCC